MFGSGALTAALGVHLDQPAVRRVIVLVFGVAGLLILSGDSPLGWDEGVYAARAKDLVNSDFSWSFRSGTYWSDVRAPGLPMLISVPFKLFGASGFVARALVLAFALALLSLIGSTLDLFFARRVGTFAVVLISLCPGFLATSTLAFADVPAIFFAMVAVYLLARWRSDPQSRSLFLVPAALGAATTIRFGSLFLVAAALLVIGLLVIVSAVRQREWGRVASLCLAAVSSAMVIWILLASRLLTTVNSPLDATRAITEINDNPAGRWVDDLATILSPGPVDYGFNGAFWGWSYALLFGVLATCAVLRLVLLRQFLVLGISGVVSVAPLLLYGWSVNQFVTTYLAPIFALGAAMVAIGLWCEPPPRSRTNGLIEAHATEPAVDEDVEVTSSGRGAPALETPTDEAVAVSAWLHWFGIRNTSKLIGAVSVALFATVGAATYQGVDGMHERLAGFEQVRVGSMIADDLLGEDCRLATSRVPQVSFYSDCAVGRLYVGQSLFDGIDDDLELDRIAQQAGAAPGSTLGLLLLEGVSGEPLVDDVWAQRIDEQSVVLTSGAGRRVGVVALEMP